VFTKTARFYDLIYGFKDYEAEVARIDALIRERTPGARTLLDVACGTGKHVELLRGRGYACEGLDLDQELLAIARERNPGVPFHHGEMAAFALGRTFDVVTCLFSSIGYARTVENLNRTVAAMASHLAPGGTLIVEPWFTPDAFLPGHIGALLVEGKELTIARVNTASVEGRLSILPFHYLIATPDRVEHLEERHEVGLFTAEEYLGAFEAAGLEPSFDPEGLMGRGLYVASRS
jgi:SAM-dependent methyltransferase